MASLFECYIYVVDKKARVDTMNLNKRLSHYRKTSGISQLEAAEALDVARQTIGRWEQGISSPSMENLLKMSALYGVPVDALVKDDWVPPEEKPPEVQYVEIPVEVPVEIPVEVPVEVPLPRNYRLWALLAAVVLAAGILVGALFFRERHEESVPESTLEGEVIDNSTIGEAITLLPFE